jgi:hypothetical protein
MVTRTRLIVTVLRTVAVVRNLLCLGITQRTVVIFTDVSGQPIGPNFKVKMGPVPL